VIPVLVYPDVRAAVEWLGAAFGFAERVRIGEDHRSQLRVGDGAVIVADAGGDRRPPRPGEASHSVMVRVVDANAHCERARAHGARITAEPRISSTANASTAPRTRRATGGRSPKRSTMSLRGVGGTSVSATPDPPS